ncbi:MAG TPA: DUF1491 family protein, partial [Roseomonas sp.]
MAPSIASEHAPGALSSRWPRRPQGGLRRPPILRVSGPMEARVKAGLWVSMATRMSDMVGRPAAVLRKGDPDAGGILC